MKTAVVQQPSGSLSTRIRLTASKSESNRALIIRAICRNAFDVLNLAKAKDTETLVSLLEHDANELDVGPAGTTMRFMTAYLACAQANGKEGSTRIITGSERMQSRPIGILVDALRTLGADIQYAGKEGYPPLRITSKNLPGGALEVDGSVSSQFISALLLIAPCLTNGLELSFRGKVISRPYLQMTLNMLKYFGADAGWLGDGTIRVGTGKYVPRDFTVEGDWSSASYWYALVALTPGGEVELEGLRDDSLQGDARCVEIFSTLGVVTTFTPKGVRLKQSGHLPASFHYHFIDCPDLAQTVAVVVAALKVPATLDGLESLRIKETDRIEALRVELGKFNVRVEVEGDQRIIIHPEQFEAKPGISIATYEDHRMAMAFAPLACKTGSVAIEEPDVVVKSYPDFWQDLTTAGFSISEAAVQD
ncbi:MAG: 3-phosphoshikimate 1-carboxyvinyltransferase [Flavobacteriales bacterium]|nr:3-phosphoshikimate 1-carboxyvinyltransferase [Flavobacteriales bacterium]MCB9446913.1 3-phosphoshikimate 1-carboxyvinyltransferase [Flavobacteriales bacterium]